MISYQPLYQTMQKKQITTYKLIQQFGVSRSLLDRLKHNKPISTVTLNDLCYFLDCRVEDVLIYIPDKDSASWYSNSSLLENEKLS